MLTLTCLAVLLSSCSSQIKTQYLFPPQAYTIPCERSVFSGKTYGFGGALGINILFGNYWGIFNQNGIPLLLADNVKSVKFQNRSKVSSAPIEQGSFAAYNKVIEPYTVNVVMTKGSGGVQERGAFLGLVDAFANSTDLFMVITPEAIYPNCNIVGYDYVREHNDGARLIKVNLHLQEIREVVVEYTKTKAETAEVMQDQGNVQAKEVSTHTLTEQADWHSADYDLQLIDNQGKRKTVLSGRIELSHDVTKVEL